MSRTRLLATLSLLAAFTVLAGCAGLPAAGLGDALRSFVNVEEKTNAVSRAVTKIQAFRPKRLFANRV